MEVVSKILFMDQHGEKHDIMDVVEYFISKGTHFGSSCMILLQRITWLLLSWWESIDDIIKDRWNKILRLGWDIELLPHHTRQREWEDLPLLMASSSQLNFLETDMKEIVTLKSKSDLQLLDQVKIAFPSFKLWMSWELKSEHRAAAPSVYANWVQHFFLSIQYHNDMVQLMKSWIVSLLHHHGDDSVIPHHIASLTSQMCRRSSIELDVHRMHWMWELLLTLSDEDIFTASDMSAVFDWVPLDTVFPFQTPG